MGEITGRKVFLFTSAAFGVIIAVNLVMAYSAINTFPGLEVKNSYVASQSFQAERDAQIALGWTLTPEYDPGQGQLRLAFTDAAGAPVQVAALEVLVGRTTVANQDQSPAFDYAAGVYTSPVTLDPGKWMLRIDARAEDGTRFHQRIELMVKG
jgi:nitrogen fixation protein FixH